MPVKIPLFRGWYCHFLRTSSKPRQSTARAYIERVNLAIDHIVANIDKPLRLTEIARAAKFSPFHFHRVFQSLVGETIADFTKRLRLERALSLMLHSPARGRSYTRIALSCGFAGASDFSRAFKQKFGAPPSRFDLTAWCEANRAELEAITRDHAGKSRLSSLPAPAGGDRFDVVIREIPARTVAYIRVSDPYEPNAVTGAIERLMAWAERHSFADNQWLGYQWENPELVPLEHCRYHAAVEAAKFTPSGEVGRFRFPAMLIAQIEIKGAIDLELRALQWFFTTWLPTSGYAPDDHPCFEAWIGRPFAHGTEYFELYAQLPIRRLR